MPRLRRPSRVLHAIAEGRVSHLTRWLVRGYVAEVRDVLLPHLLSALLRMRRMSVRVYHAGHGEVKARTDALSQSPPLLQRSPR